MKKTNLIIRRMLDTCRRQGLITMLSRSLFYVWWRVKWLCLWCRGEYTYSFGNRNCAVRMLITTLSEAKGLEIVSRLEWQIAYSLAKEICPDDVFWEVGAHVGFHSCGVAKLFPTVRVVAFEPNPTRIRVLKRNVRHNSLSNIEVQQIALTDYDGTGKFDPTGVHNPLGGSGLVTSGHNFIQVQTATGDSLVGSRALPPPDIMMIDVEGAESLVLEGCRNILRRCRVVFCEIHGATELTGERVCPVIQKLEESGFVIRMIQRHGTVSHIKASRADVI